MAKSRKPVSAERGAEILAEMQGKNDAMGNQAAELLAKTAEADPPSGVSVEEDFDFLGMDPTDCEPYLAEHGMKQDPAMAYRWANGDPKYLQRREHQGWRVVAGGRIKHGANVLVEMPKTRQASIRRQIEERNKLLQRSPLDKFGKDVDKLNRQVGGGRELFGHFDGDESLRAGLD